MQITRPAIAGTLESSDCLVTVEACEEGIEFELNSVVMHQYGNQIRKVAMETLENLGVEAVRLTIVDKGALDCTIRARIEGAVYRSVQKFDSLDWGGGGQCEAFSERPRRANLPAKQAGASAKGGGGQCEAFSERPRRANLPAKQAGASAKGGAIR